MVNYWTITTTAESWELTKTHNVHAFNREADRDKVKPGDKVICYLVRSDPPAFVGADEIAGPWEEAKEPFWPEEKAQGKVIWPWRFHCTALRRGAVSARKLSAQLSFIENKQAWSVYFMGSIGNFGRPIPETDYLLIFEELAKPPIPYEVRPVPTLRAPPVAEVPKRRKIPQLPGPVPSHKELRDIIRDIGVMKKLVAETEYPINGLQLDVAWRTEAQRMPSRVWEVHIAGNFIEALTKLRQAWEYWRAEPFLVTTEKSAASARSQLVGVFSDIKPHIRIIRWEDIVRLYKLLSDTTEIEGKLRL
jgi:predicted RNA-binding protein